MTTTSGRQGGRALEVVLKLLEADAPRGVYGVPQDWPRWAVLLPHVLAATGHLDILPHTVEADASWLLDRAATYLQVHGRLAEARPLAERALAIAETAHGPGHLNVSACLNDLALIVRELGQSAEARPLAERALAITEAAYGPDHPTVAIRLGNLGMILQDLGQPAGARPLAERALAITQGAYGPDHPDIALRRSNLDAILRALGEPAEGAAADEANGATDRGWPN